MHLEATAVQVDSVSEVLLYEADVLLEGNEPILVSVQLLENIDQIFPGGLDFDKEAEFCEHFDKIVKIDLNCFPVDRISVSVFSFEDDFSEVDG